MGTWVQGRSGEKFRVESESTRGYVIRDRRGELWHVPYAEFVKCEPPERWVDVRVETGGDLALLYMKDSGHTYLVGSIDKPGYKFVLASGNTFKIQKKVLDNQENP